MSLLLLLSDATHAAPGGSFFAVAEWPTSGLVGTIGVRLTYGNTVITPRTTAGIIEYPAGSSIYMATMSAPSGGGPYQIVWDDGTNYAEQDLVLIDLSAIAAGVTIGGTVDYIGAVATSGDVTLVQGDDYNNTDGRALEWTSTGWPDLAGASLLFTIRPRNSETQELQKAGSVVVSSGTAKVRVELTSTETAALSTSGNHRFDLQATLANGRIVTLVIGRVTIQSDVT